MSDRVNTEPLEIIGPAFEQPDFSDIAKVVFNVEMHDGQQFSMILEPRHGMVLSLQSDHEGDMEEVVSNDGTLLRTIFRGPQAWEFVIRLDEV